MQTISLIIHVMAAAALFGPQLMMFYAVTPATWMITNEETRRVVMKVVGGRFGQLTVVALVLLLVTGLYQYYSIVPEIRRDPEGYRFGTIFATKMGAFATIIVLIGVHVGVFSRRIARLSDAVIAGDESERGALETARSQSFLFSLVLLIVTLGTLALGVMLGDESFSHAQW